jgi:hypothetical protein
VYLISVPDGGSFKYEQFKNPNRLRSFTVFLNVVLALFIHSISMKGSSATTAKKVQKSKEKISGTIVHSYSV